MYQHVHIRVKYIVIPVVFKIDSLKHEVSLETFILYISFSFFFFMENHTLLDSTTVRRTSLNVILLEDVI